ncbi:unnamed protein product [Polarella glacialis]|uniref:Uncharacterized protein n=1 Tax=Polarella glacialis TaxID=89957 RepID=A0A813I2W9_POLGL|nr:unnamed protein product [Polarella glacialis]
MCAFPMPGKCYLLMDSACLFIITAVPNSTLNLKMLAGSSTFQMGGVSQWNDKSNWVQKSRRTEQASWGERMAGTGHLLAMATATCFRQSDPAIAIAFKPGVDLV